MPTTFNGVEFRINPNVVIGMNPNTSLALRNCDLYACEGMWRGIFLEDGCSVTINQGTQIEDALTALNSDDKSATSFDLSDCTFNRNDIGINMVRSSLDTNAPQFNQMDNVSFTCDSPLNNGENQISFAGIHSSGHPVICNMNNTTFEGLQKGIIAITGSKSFISGKGNHFENITDDGMFFNFAEFQFKDFEFKNCGDACIRLDKASDIFMNDCRFITTDEVSPFQNTLTQHYGLVIDDYAADNVVRVVDCLFNNLTDRFKTVTHISIHDDIFNNANNATTLLRNNFFMRGFSSMGINMTGSYAPNSSSNILANDFLFTGNEDFSSDPNNSGSSTGILIDGGSLPIGVNNLNIFDNDFTVGSQRRDINDIGISLNASSGQDNEVTGNRFVYQGPVAIFMNGSLQARNVGFSPCIDVNNFDHTRFCENENINSVEEFRYISFLDGIDFIANNSRVGRLLSIFPSSSIGSKLHQGNNFVPAGIFQPVFHNPQARAFNPLFSLFEVHTEQADNYDGDFSPFHPVHIIPDNNNEWWSVDDTGTPVVSCQDQIQDPTHGNMFRYIQTAEDNIGAYLDTEEEVFIAERKFYEMLTRNPTLLSSEEKFSSFLRRNEHTNMGHLAHIANTLRAWNQDKENTDLLQSALQSNTNITSHLTPIRNEQFVNRIILNQLLNENREIADDDIIPLINIAEQCPRYGGIGVFQARYLLNACQLSSYDDIYALTNCYPELNEIESRTSQTKEEFAQSVDIYPNPSNTDFQITGVKKGYIQVFDLKGREVLAQNFISNQKIDISFLPSGIYNYRVLNRSAEEPITGKFIKQN